MYYSVFAISEEGTESVDSFDTEDEANEERLRLMRLLEDKKWENNTSLSNVVGFNVDEWDDV